MSTAEEHATTGNARSPSRQALIRLLKEYSDKLRDIALQAQALRDKHDKAGDDQREYLLQSYYALENQTQRLMPIIGQLNRRVSQYLEHSEIDDLERIEIEIRLGELGVLMEGTDHLLHVARPPS